MTTQPAPSTTRLIAKVVRELVAAHLFASYADLAQVVRERLRRLRIRYRPAEFDAAIALVASNRALVRPPAVLPRPAVADESSQHEIGRAEAAAILARLNALSALKTMRSQKPQTVLDWRAQAELIVQANLDMLERHQQQRAQWRANVAAAIERATADRRELEPV